MNTENHFSGIPIFIAAVEAGSFSKAAEKLNLSKSAISKSISILEHRLETSLFHRTTRQLKLTDEGRSYYESCLRAFNELSEAQANLRSLKQNPTGKVRMDLPVLYGKRWILPAILELSEIYPKINFDVTFSNQTIDLIEEDIDLVVRIGNLDSRSSLRARVLGNQPITICASPKYLKEKGTPKTLEDLKQHSCIVENAAKTWLIKTAEGKIKNQQVASHLRLAGPDTCLHAALSHKGIVQVPTWLAAKHLENGELKSLLDSHSPTLPVHAVWPKTQQKTDKKIRIIIDELIKRLEP
jgi:DNA-binding transcriptional LysR family regulator